jgi:hypothetical protein
MDQQGLGKLFIGVFAVFLVRNSAILRFFALEKWHFYVLCCGFWQCHSHCPVPVTVAVAVAVAVTVLYRRVAPQNDRAGKTDTAMPLPLRHCHCGSHRRCVWVVTLPLPEQPLPDQPLPLSSWPLPRSHCQIIHCQTIHSHCQSPAYPLPPSHCHCHLTTAM